MYACSFIWLLSALSGLAWSKWQSCQAISSLYLLNTLYGSRALDFLRGVYQDLLEWHNAPSKKSCAVFMRAEFLPIGYVYIYGRWLYHQKTMPVSVSWGERVFFSPSRLRVTLISQTERLYGPTILAAARYPWKHPYWCQRRTQDQCRFRDMLAHRHHNWNHRNLSHVLFAN